jgi:predicted enzyme related to lactoylglutathione lyase
MDMRIELILLPSTDVDRTKAFYADKVGFVLDHDVQPGNGMRVVQLTPPGSSCSIGFGTGMIDPSAPPVQSIHLVVDDLDAVRATLVGNGVGVSAVQDVGGGIRYAYFSDPDDNSWALQEISR